MPENLIRSPFNDYSSFLRNKFSCRVQKISINVGSTCPNRDGTKGRGGCSYCNIHSIQPVYASKLLSVSRQLTEGIKRFQNRGKTGKYLAYFQSYTNTYAELQHLKSNFEEALMMEDVVGIVIGTRPDCLSHETILYLSELSKKTYISVELGIESTYNDTLLKINRCHTFEDTIFAIHQLHAAGINIGGHLILGFPWETDEMILQQADLLSKLPLESLKLHHLQILKHTALSKELNEHNYIWKNPSEYLNLIIEFLGKLNPDIIVQRFISESPQDLIIAPQWNGMRNYQFTEMLKKKMISDNEFQGKHYIA